MMIIARQLFGGIDLCEMFSPGETAGCNCGRILICRPSFQDHKNDTISQASNKLPACFILSRRDNNTISIFLLLPKIHYNEEFIK